MRARGFRPCVLHARAPTRSAAPPRRREIWLETAAVRRPPSAQRLQLRHLLERGVAARALVAGARRRAARSRASKRPSSIARIARRWLSSAKRSMSSREMLPLLGDHLGAAELRDLLRAVARHPALRARERIGEAERLRQRHRRRDRDHAHVLHAAGDDEVAGAAHHGLRGEVHGLLRRAALAVDRHARARRSGSPAASQQVRAMSPACGPIVSSSRRPRPRRRRDRRRCARPARAARARRGRRGAPARARRRACRPASAPRRRCRPLPSSVSCCVQKVVPGPIARARREHDAATRARCKRRAPQASVERPGAPHPEVEVVLPV